MIANSANRYATKAKLQKKSQMTLQKLLQSMFGFPSPLQLGEPGCGLRVSLRTFARLDMFRTNTRWIGLPRQERASSSTVRRSTISEAR
ncbi:hypothetical protein GCM10009820_22610 [Leifsonia soli]